MISDKKYLGVDYGTKRVGLAIGSVYPKPAGLIDAVSGPQNLAQEIARRANDLEAEGIVFGLPTFPSGDENDLTSEVKALGEATGIASGLPVFYEPEGYTSVEAENSISGGAKKGDKDQVAAVIILEQFFNRQNG